MEPAHPLAFGPFHLDGPKGRLWRGAQAIALRPQSLALLRYLVTHPGRLVTQAELRQHVWAGTHLTDIVVLEDLQWSDQATVEALAYLAQRRGLARLLVLGTYRPVEAAPCSSTLCGTSCASCADGDRRWNCAWSCSPMRR